MGRLFEIEELFFWEFHIPEPVDLGDRIQQLHKDIKTRARSLEKYKDLRKQPQFWRHDFKQATLGRYECLYVFQGKLYQGHSRLHDIYRYEKRKPITEPVRVLGEMYE